jgi:hypothetical protein
MRRNLAIAICDKVLREAFWTCALERGEEYDGESSICGEAQSPKLHVLQISS